MEDWVETLLFVRLVTDALNPLCCPCLSQFALPGKGNGRTPVPWSDFVAGLGFDPEKAVFHILSDLRLKTSFRQYARLRWTRHGEKFYFDMEEGTPMLAGLPVGTGKEDPTDPQTYGMHFDAVTGLIKHVDSKVPLARAAGQVKFIS